MFLKFLIKFRLSYFMCICTLNFNKIHFILILYVYKRNSMYKNMEGFFKKNKNTYIRHILSK